MNYLILLITVVVAFAIAAWLWRKHGNLVAPVAAFFLLVGLVAALLPWDSEPIPRLAQQQAIKAPGSTESEPATNNLLESMPSELKSSNSETPKSGASDAKPVLPTMAREADQSDPTGPRFQIRNASLTMEQLEPSRPAEIPTHGFVGSDACIECHAENHASWDASYHSKMTQVADPKIVLGDFDNVQVTHKKELYYLSKNENTCMVDIPGEGGKGVDRVTAPVVMTTGSHHMQVYWFPTNKGREIAMLPLIHLNETNEWIPRESAFLVLPHDEPAHEIGRWNDTCSRCHSTHRKGRRLGSGEWDTHVGEFGISCEACHGAGGGHVDFQREAAADHTSVADRTDPIVNPESLTKVRSSQVCGQCHSVNDPLQLGPEFEEHGQPYRAGDDLTKTHGVWNRDTPELENTRKQLNYPDLDTLLNETFYPDGMIRVSGREYNGLLESECYISGEMSCLSCHKMHKSESDQRTMTEWANDQLHPEALGDSACTQCHENDKYGQSHTHHAVGSSGASCYNCHMPHTAYGLLKAIRNHEISSPDVGKDDGATRPNACNMCHLDKSLKWSADHLQEWYDIEPPELDADKRELAASIIWLLRGNAAERAIAAWAMGWKDAQQTSGTEWMTPFLVSMLDDDYDAIRLIARRSLRTIPSTADFELDVVTSTTSQQRQRAALGAFEEWLAATAETRRDRPDLLINAKTGFDIQRVNKLLEKRDNTPMLLSE